MADVIILGNLTLTSSPYGVKVNGHDFLEPQPELTMRARAFRDGDVLVKKRYPNVIRTIQLIVSSSDGTKDSLNGNLRAIETELRKLDVGDSLVLQYTPNGGSVDNFSDVISGSRQTRLEWFYTEKNTAIEAILHLECEPFWRGEQITIAQQTFSPTPAILAASTVSGDIETPVFVEIAASSNGFGNDLYVGTRKAPISETLFDPLKDFQGNSSNSTGFTHNGEFSTVAVTSAFTSVTGDNDDLYAVSFSTATPAIGWAVGDAGVVFKTTNGANTWSEQTSNVGIRLTGVQALGDNTVFACGKSGVVIRTTDGGATWSLKATGTLVDFNALVFSSSNVGWVTGSGVASFIMRTTDGFTSTGAITTQLEGVPGTLNIVDITAPTSNVLYACGNDEDFGAIFKTTGSGEAGSTWVNDSGNAFDSLRSINAPTSNVVFSCGSSGTLVRTTGGGGSTGWTAQTSNETGELNKIRMNSSSVGWFAGNNGVLRVTADGSTWTAQASGTGSTLIAIYIVDANTIYIVGFGFLVIKTVDGGTTWTQPAAGWSLSSVQDYRGRYIVFLRCRSETPSNTEVRASAGFAGGTVVTNDTVTMLNSTTFQILNLGEINVPITRVSDEINPTPIIKLEARGTTEGNPDKNFDADIGVLLPIDGEAVFIGGSTANDGATQGQAITLDSDMNAVNKGFQRVTWNGSPPLLRPGLRNNIVILETSTGSATNKQKGINDALVTMKYFARFLSPESSG